MSDENIVQLAENYAKNKHNSQKRDDGEPFFNHPRRIVETLKEYDLPDEVLAAAWLHDVPEDCSSSYEDCINQILMIEQKFGNKVSSLVHELTCYSEKGELFEQKTIRLLNLARRMSINAKWIKLADRFDNISSMQCWNNKRRIRYARSTIKLLDNLCPIPEHSDTLFLKILNIASQIIETEDVINIDK